MKIIISGNSVVHWCVLIVSGLQWSSTALREKTCQSLIHPCVLLQDGLSKSDMEKLTFYAVSAPEKLDRIGAYLAERLSRDVVRHRYGWASISPRLFFFSFFFCSRGRLSVFSQTDTSRAPVAGCNLNVTRFIVNRSSKKTQRSSTCCWNRAASSCMTAGSLMSGWIHEAAQWTFRKIHLLPHNH